MSSVHEVIPWAGHVNYAASKGGVMMMMKSIAQEVAPLPHPRQLDRARRDSHADQYIRVGYARGVQQVMHLVPYKRIGEPEDIGRAAVWLACDQADYITGTTLFVDGGMTLYPGLKQRG